MTATIMDGLTAIIFNSMMNDGAGNMKEKLLILSGTLTCLVFGIALIVSLIRFPQSNVRPVVLETETESMSESLPETQPSTKPMPTTEPIPTETVSTTEHPNIEETEPTEIILYHALAPFLEADNRTIDDLPDTQQLIIVASSGMNADVYAFELDSNEWKEVFQTSGVVGKNGVSSQSREGDYRTPKGIFPLGIAFGTESLNRLSVEYRKINDDCYWVDDPESEYYNQWVESKEILWNSAEHLADFPKAYHYAVAINYNMNPVIPYAGSAIFLHCRTADYTAGCVGIPTSDMIQVLQWLNASRNPTIWIY